jgi:hypothetical protein
MTGNCRLSFNRVPLRATYQIPNKDFEKEFQIRLRLQKTTPTLATDVHHIPRRLFKTRFANVVPRLFLHHYLSYIRTKLHIRSAPYHTAVQIVVALGKQAGPHLPI